MPRATPVAEPRTTSPTGGVTQVQHTWEMLSRVDYNINDTNRMTFRAIRESWLFSRVRISISLAVTRRKSPATAAALTTTT